MKIVYFGSSDFGIPCLDALRASEHRLVKVFTQPAHRAGRGRKCTPTPVFEWAERNNIECIEAENINSQDMKQAVRGCDADLLVVIAFGQKVCEELIKMHKFGAINVHGSLLPRWRGAAPVNAAVVSGDTETGITIITLADRMDAGYMLGKASVRIDPEDTAGDVHKKLAELSPPTLLKVISEIEDGTAVYEKQDESQVTVAKKLKKSDGYIDWSESAETINNKIRGYAPWPGAQTDYVSGKMKKCSRVTITKARVRESEDSSGQYGKLDENLYVICGTGKLEILELKPAGKGEMSFKAFANGRGLRPGDAFMNIETAKQNA